MRLLAVLPLFLVASVAARAQAPGLPNGFAPLFNGRDLSGWHWSRTNHHGTTALARVEDGALVLQPRPFGQGGLLLTDTSYTDFELTLECLPDPGYNSGIFLRSTEGGSAYQIELVRPGNAGALLGEQLKLTPPQYVGPRVDVNTVWKDGEWNRMRVRMEGEAPHVTLWINDTKMWEAVEPRNDQIGGAYGGMIGLQLHWSATYTSAAGGSGSGLPWSVQRFRNIGIKALNVATGVPPSRPTLAERASVSSFGGPNLQVRPPAAPQETMTSPSGIELVLIHPGRMTVGVFHPPYPTPPAPGTAPARGATPLSPDDYARIERMARADWSDGFVVDIPRPYYIGKYEITQAQWSQVMGRNPSMFQGDQVADDAARHPVERVTWDEAQAFVKALNAREQTDAYRLPTEFEWEYAARAGDDGDLPWAQIRAQAIAGYNAYVTTHMVGEKQPNAWGVYDMLGNVWEWVEDFYNEKLFADPAPPKTGTQHVLKGGGFAADVKNAIPATHAAGPGSGFDVGLRVVREVR